MPTTVDVGTDTSTKTVVKPTVQPDVKLAALFKEQDKAKGQAAKATVAVIDYLKKNSAHVTNAVLIATLISARGLAETSAKTEASKIMGYLHPDNAEKLEKLRNGEITLQVMKNTAIRVGGEKGRPRKTDMEKFLEGCGELSNRYIATVLQDPNNKGASRQAFLEALADSYDYEFEQYEESKNVSQGQVSGGTTSEPTNGSESLGEGSESEGEGEGETVLSESN